MFPGSGRRRIDLAGSKQPSRDDLLRQARADRERRFAAKRSERVQKFVRSRIRGRLLGLRERNQLRARWDARFSQPEHDVVHLLRIFVNFWTYRVPEDHQRLEQMTQLLISDLRSSNSLLEELSRDLPEKAPISGSLESEGYLNWLSLMTKFSNIAAFCLADRESPRSLVLKLSAWYSLALLENSLSLPPRLNPFGRLVVTAAQSEIIHRTGTYGLLRSPSLRSLLARNQLPEPPSLVTALGSALQAHHQHNIQGSPAPALSKILIECLAKIWVRCYTAEKYQRPELLGLSDHLQLDFEERRLAATHLLIRVPRFLELMLSQRTVRRLAKHVWLDAVAHLRSFSVDQMVGQDGFLLCQLLGNLVELNLLVRTKSGPPTSRPHLLTDVLLEIFESDVWSAAIADWEIPFISTGDQPVRPIPDWLATQLRPLSEPEFLWEMLNDALDLVLESSSTIEVRDIIRHEFLSWDPSFSSEHVRKLSAAASTVSKLLNYNKEDLSLLNYLAFKEPMVEKLWMALVSPICRSHLFSDNFGFYHPIMPATVLLYDGFRHRLKIQDDHDFRPFYSASDDSHPNLQNDLSIETLVHHLQQFLTNSFWTWSLQGREPVPIPTSSAVLLYRQLQEIHDRHPFLPVSASSAGDAGDPPNPFLLPGIPIVPETLTGMSEDGNEVSRRSEKQRLETDLARRVLASLPFAVPFSVRVELFYIMIGRDRRALQASGVEFDHGLGVSARVRRSHVLQDGFQELNHLGRHLRGRIMITFLGPGGAPEAGVDGGGVFKDFLTNLGRMVFNPEYGLWKESESHKTLYPNPSSGLMFSEDAWGRNLEYFEFVGRMVGKALYEGHVLEPQFANFFLRSVLGQSNYLADLRSLDPQMYNSLCSLKKFQGDWEDLALSFSTLRPTSLVGESPDEVVELIPNGESTPVTQDNVIRYLYLISDYLLNQQVKPQVDAFRRGLCDILNPVWFEMFSAPELQILISGTPQAFEVEDLRRNTIFAGGLHANDNMVRWLWEILDSFDDSQKSAFLFFTTSCSRAPLLGLGSLYPTFSIQKAGGPVDDRRLPTSSTCLHLLRLPPYPSKDVLKERLLYAINESLGFGLS